MNVEVSWGLGFLCVPRGTGVPALARDEVALVSGPDHVVCAAGLVRVCDVAGAVGVERVVVPAVGAGGARGAGAGDKGAGFFVDAEGCRGGQGAHGKAQIQQRLERGHFGLERAEWEVMSNARVGPRVFIALRRRERKAWSYACTSN